MNNKQSQPQPPRDKELEIMEEPMPVPEDNDGPGEASHQHEELESELDDETDEQDDPQAVNQQHDPDDANAADNNQQQQQQEQQQQQYQQQAVDDVNIVLGIDDPNRMRLTEEEVEWALDIKDAIEMLPEIDNLNDFWYAQLAVIHQDDIEAAVERAQNLQLVRQEYGIQGTEGDGRRLLHALIRLLPRQFLSFSYNHQDGNYVLAFDVTQFDLTILASPEKTRTWLAAGFYLYQAMNPDLEAVRRGIVFLVECEGYEWSKNCFEIKSMRKLFTECALIYPAKIQLMKHFHTGMFFNLTASMVRAFLPPEMRRKFQTGCEIEGRLDSFYLVPTVEMANQRMLRRMEESLHRRYNHEATFSLPESSLHG